MEVKARAYFDEIFNAIVNGQREEAFLLMKAIDPSDRSLMIDYFYRELRNNWVTVEAAKIFMSRA